MALPTPLTCWKTPCTPQKQPPASTITSEDAPPGAMSRAGAGSMMPSCAAVGIDIDRSTPTSRVIMIIPGTLKRLRMVVIVALQFGRGAVGLERQRHAIDAIAQAGGVRAVMEDWPMLPAAPPAMHGFANHAERRVADLKTSGRGS